MATLAACGDGGDVAAQGAAAGRAAPAEPGLQGLWNVKAAGEPSGTVLQLSGGDWLLMRPCGEVSGTWAARGGLFLAHTDHRPDSTFGPRDPQSLCPPAERAVPTWVGSVAGYRAEGGGWDLIDATGSTVVELNESATWPTNHRQDRAYIEFGGDDSPVPNSQERARLNALPAAALPAGVRAPAAADLFGRWQLSRVQPRCELAWIQFDRDGSWRSHNTARDENARAEGSWVLGADGLALGTAVPMAGSDCVTYDGAPETDHAGLDVNVWMLRLARLGLDGTELVLYDPDGIELARTHRTPIPTPTPTPEPPDPRAAGVKVPGGVKYLASYAEHLFYLSSGNDFPEYEQDWPSDTIFGGDRSGKGAILLTGCWGGDMWVTVRSRTTPPAPLAQAMKGWEVGEENTMTIRKPLSAFDGEEWGEQIFTPTVPGLHRVRVLAKGRAIAYDDVCDPPVEEYEITIWPVLAKEPRERRGDDGV